MKPRIVLIGALLVLAGAATTIAQIEEHPGYFPVDQFGILAADTLSLEINLNRAILGLVAAALRIEEPELAGLIAGLDSIRVRVAEADSFELEQVRSRLKDATVWLDNHDWNAMLRLREDGEEIYVYSQITDGVMRGVAILAVESDGDAVLVNIVGSLDAEQLGGLAEALNIPQLGLAAGLGSSRGNEDDEENRR